MSRLTRDGTADARPNSRARTGTGEYVFPVQLTTSKIGNLTRLIRTLLPGIYDDHTYLLIVGAQKGMVARHNHRTGVRRWNIFCYQWWYVCSSHFGLSLKHLLDFFADVSSVFMCLLWAVASSVFIYFLLNCFLPRLGGAVLN